MKRRSVSVPEAVLEYVRQQLDEKPYLSENIILVELLTEGLRAVQKKGKR